MNYRMKIYVSQTHKLRCYYYRLVKYKSRVNRRIIVEKIILGDGSSNSNPEV